MGKVQVTKQQVARKHFPLYEEKQKTAKNKILLVHRNYISSTRSTSSFVVRQTTQTLANIKQAKKEERTIDSFCWISLHLSARTHSSLWERVLNILESWPGDVVEIANANNEFRWIEFFILRSVHDVSWMVDLTWVANKSSFLFRDCMKIQLTDLSLFCVESITTSRSVLQWKMQLSESEITVDSYQFPLMYVSSLL